MAEPTPSLIYKDPNDELVMREAMFRNNGGDVVVLERDPLFGDLSVAQKLDPTQLTIDELAPS